MLSYRLGTVLMIADHRSTDHQTTGQDSSSCCSKTLRYTLVQDSIHLKYIMLNSAW